MSLIRYVTRKYIEDNCNTATPEFTKGACAYYDFDTDAFVYTEWYLVPFVKFWYWYGIYRWAMEVYMCRYGIFLDREDGQRSKDARFRWDFWNIYMFHRRFLKRPFDECKTRFPEKFTYLSE